MIDVIDVQKLPEALLTEGASQWAKSLKKKSIGVYFRQHGTVF